MEQQTLPDEWILPDGWGLEIAITNSSTTYTLVCHTAPNHLTFHINEPLAFVIESLVELANSIACSDSVIECDYNMLDEDPEVFRFLRDFWTCYELRVPGQEPDNLAGHLLKIPLEDSGLVYDLLKTFPEGNLKRLITLALVHDKPYIRIMREE